MWLNRHGKKMTTSERIDAKTIHTHTHTSLPQTPSLPCAFSSHKTSHKSFFPLHFYKFLDKNESLAGMPLCVSVAVDGVWVDVDLLMFLFHIPLVHLQICVNMWISEYQLSIVARRLAGYLFLKPPCINNGSTRIHRGHLTPNQGKDSSLTLTVGALCFVQSLSQTPHFRLFVLVPSSLCDLGPLLTRTPGP